MKFSVISATFNQIDFLKENKVYWDNQTLKDFELIIADDGSWDGTREWAKEAGIKVVGNKEHKFDYDWSVHNEAAKVAKGDYLVWVMGDSYPKEDFLERLSKLLTPDRVVNGMRVNVDNNGKFVSKDWRDKGVSEDATAIRVDWGNMTLNSISIHRDLFKKIGGFYKGYKGYGRADIELIIRAKNLGAEMWVAPKAVIYHRVHDSVPENPENVKIFDQRMKGLI